MSQHIRPGGHTEPAAPESGLEALRQSSAFQGSVEPVETHEHSNDHFALIYETEEELFDATGPFIRQGLERGEQCVYVLDDRSEAEVVERLRSRGIDVTDAIELGALTFRTVQETYFRNRPFDPDEMISFYDGMIDAPLEEYEGLRVIAGTNWIEDVSFEDFLQYEGRVNELFDETDSMALCHYDRSRLSPDLIRDIIKTHPHLISEGTVCHNFYYTPPAELFGPDQPENEIDRMLGTVRDRARAKTDLAEHNRFLRDLYEITASSDRSFEEKLDALFELGCEQFDIGFGFLNRVDPVADHLEIEYASGDHEHYEVGAELQLSETYCKAAVDIEAAASISDPVEDGFDDILVYEEFGVGTYLGTYIPVGGDADRTLAFVPGESREEPFSEQDKTFIELMGQWIGYELNRQQREQFLRECYEITAEPTYDFEEKLDALFEVGCDRFGLDLGGVARLGAERDAFEVEYVSSDHEHIAPGISVDLSQADCPGDAETAVAKPVGITDFDANGVIDAACGADFGIETYLGTRLPIDGDDDRVFFFVSENPRSRGFSTSERTFLDLMGQWVQYELERQQYERELETTIAKLQQSNERLKQFAYAASHDLQEPLRMVSTYLQLLERQYANDLDADAREYIDFAVNGADRMREMVDDLLAYSRVEQTDRESRPVSCDTIFEAVTNDLQVRIEETGAEISAEALPTIVADREQVEQLFQNLLSNAIKYSGDEPPRIEVSAERRGEMWQFAVADDGIGIDPAKTDRIFEVFKRLHHDEECSGTGIGLSLCQEIVETHGGDIWVESEPGKGSTFYFTLPGADGAAGSQA